MKKINWKNHKAQLAGEGIFDHLEDITMDGKLVGVRAEKKHLTMKIQTDIEEEDLAYSSIKVRTFASILSWVVGMIAFTGFVVCFWNKCGIIELLFWGMPIIALLFYISVRSEERKKAVLDVIKKYTKE